MTFVDGGSYVAGASTTVLAAEMTVEMSAMVRPGRERTNTHRGTRWLARIQQRLRDPALLTIAAVAFFISAIGQAILQAYVNDDSIVTTAVLSALGSAFLAAAIIVAALRHDRRPK